MIQDAINQIAGHYNNLFDQHGDSAEAHQDREDVRLNRLQAICNILPMTPFTILDYGCGTGDLVQVLRDSDRLFQLTGVDIADKLLDCARQKYSHLGHSYCLPSQLPDTFKADYVVISGIFNISTGNRQQDEAIFCQTIERCWSYANNALIFNCLTSHVDFLNSELFYCDPGWVISQIKQRFGYRTPFALFNQYILRPGCETPYEQTFCVFKSPRIPVPSRFSFHSSSTNQANSSL